MTRSSATFTRATPGSSTNPNGRIRPTCWIEYVLNPRFQGNGYATEAVGCLISWLFRRGAAVVHANTYADNVASIRLLEHLDFVVDESFSVEQDESGRAWRPMASRSTEARYVPG